MSVKDQLDKIHEQTTGLVEAAKAEKAQVDEVLQRLVDIQAKQEQVIEELRQNQVDVSELEKIAEQLSEARTDIENIFVPDTK